MADVKLNNLELARMSRLQASAPQQPESRQVGNGSADIKRIQPEAQPDAKSVTESVSTEAVAEQSKEQAERVKEAVTKLNDYVQSVQRDLQFAMDNDSGKTVITVVDRHTNEVVRQIPDDLALKLAQNLQQDEPLSLFNVTV